MKAAKWVPSDLDLAPTLNIADFACVSEFLDRPSQFLDYFYRRAKLQKAIDTFGFELDFLGFYFEKNFYVPPSGRKYRLVLAGMSQKIDLYYQNLGLGYSGDKPTPRMHRLVGDLIDRLEGRRPRGWTTMVRNLLAIGDLDDQAHCAAELEKLRQLVESNPDSSDQLHALVITSEIDPNLVIIFNIESSKKRARNSEKISIIIEKELADSGRSQCLFINRSIDRWETEPYDLIAIAGL